MAQLPLLLLLPLLPLLLLVEPASLLKCEHAFTHAVP
jgi:hypothetical protein